MLRNISSVIAGLLAGMCVITLVQSLSHYLYPLPEGVNPGDKAQMKMIMEMIPSGALFLLLAAYALGSFSAGFVTSFISGSSIMIFVFITGALLCGAGIINLLRLPHPLWFSVVSLLLYIPLALAGGAFGKNIRKKNSAGL